MKNNLGGNIMKRSKVLMLAVTFLFIGSLAYSQTITLTNPHSGDTWCKGTAYNITWAKTGSQDANVKIRLYDTTGTTKILDITNSTANDGSFGPWNVPASVANGNYVVRVKTLDNAVWDDSDVFAITACPTVTSSITVNSPHAGHRFCKEDSFVISWTKSGSQNANVKIRLYDTTGTTKILDITNSTANDGNYGPWMIPGSIASGNYVVRVKTLDNVVFDDSGIFNIRSCSDGGRDWERLKDILAGMKMIKWWEIHGPRPPGPDPCLTCGLEFDLNKLINVLRNKGIRHKFIVELVGGGTKIADFGEFGGEAVIRTRRVKTLRSPLSARGSFKLQSRTKLQDGLLRKGSGFKLVIKNMKGEVMFEQPVQVNERRARQGR
jgi:5-hydroxyisourate hydrolase-like protein (transthyretin family)